MVENPWTGLRCSRERQPRPRWQVSPAIARGGSRGLTDNGMGNGSFHSTGRSASSRGSIHIESLSRAWQARSVICTSAPFASDSNLSIWRFLPLYRRGVRLGNTSPKQPHNQQASARTGLRLHDVSPQNHHDFKGVSPRLFHTANSSAVRQLGFPHRGRSQYERRLSPAREGSHTLAFSEKNGRFAWQCGSILAFAHTFGRGRPGRKMQIRPVAHGLAPQGLIVFAAWPCLCGRLWCSRRRRGRR